MIAASFQNFECIYFTLHALIAIHFRTCPKSHRLLYNCSERLSTFYILTSKYVWDNYTSFLNHESLLLLIFCYFKSCIKNWLRYVCLPVRNSTLKLKTHSINAAKQTWLLEYWESWIIFNAFRYQYCTKFTSIKINSVNFHEDKHCRRPTLQFPLSQKKCNFLFPHMNMGTYSFKGEQQNIRNCYYHNILLR